VIVTKANIVMMNLLIKQVERFELYRLAKQKVQQDTARH
jgi:hypothetical protein